MSTFFTFDTTPGDPDAPEVLSHYKGIWVGSKVLYRNTAWGGKTGGMDGTFTVSELIGFDTEEGPYVVAVLDQGEWEVNADNLVLEESVAHHDS